VRRGMAGAGPAPAPAPQRRRRDTAVGRFYGRGKVYLCGLGELQAISEYGNAPVVDRFLRQLLVDAAGPLFARAEDTVTTYPALLVAGEANVVLSLSAGTAQLKTPAGILAVALTAGPRSAAAPCSRHTGRCVLEVGAPHARSR